MQVINLTLAFPEIRFNEIDFPPDTDPDDVFPRTTPFVGGGITLISTSSSSTPHPPKSPRF